MSLFFKNTNQVNMKYLVIVIIALCAGFYFFSSTPPAKAEFLADLPSAFRKAQEENKLLFVLFGRENCGNCRSLKSYIDSKEVILPEDKFVYAIIDCDNPQSKKSFYGNFKVVGQMLPLVVVAGPYGKQIAERSGYGTPEEFTQLIGDALTQR
jgi:thioredoxin-related protein